MSSRIEQYPTEFPPQEQKLPGLHAKMTPEPFYDNPEYKGSEKLKNKVALITGGDSGIGRSVAVFFAREGADVSIVYLPEEEVDAQVTKKAVEKEGKKCLLLSGDLRTKKFCEEVVEKTVQEYGKLDVLVNHAGKQYYQDEFVNVTEEHLLDTFQTNVYPYFWVSQAAVKHLKKGSCIIFTNSINSYKGNDRLIDYSASKGAGTVLTMSLAQNLAEKGIRVNAVAPGPIWTPLIPGSFPADEVKEFGQNSLMKRAGQPEECAPAYVFLASEICSSYLTGQTIHPNGGKWFQ